MDTSPKKFSWNIALIVVLVVGLLGAGLSAFIQTKRHAAPAPVAQAQLAALAASTTDATASTAEQGPSAGSGSGSSYGVSDMPDRLVIPSIGVSAHIESVGLHWRNDGTMGIPSNFVNVAWYNGGPPPGMPGSAVIAGHLDGANTPEAVFYSLDKLKLGDIVEVQQQGGATLRFKVVASKLYDYKAPTTDIFLSDSTKSRLNIITCAGVWDPIKKNYSQRLVVFTELVS